MQKSDSIKELAGALAKAQGEMRAAEMSATNPFLKNRYADLGAVIQAAKPTLAKHGLSVAQPVSGNGEFITVTTLLMHESGEWIEETISLPLGDERGKSQAQVAGSIVTYLRRYSLASMLGMYADEDQDGEAPKQAKPQAQPQPREQVIMRELQTEPPAPTNGNGKPATAPEPVKGLEWDQAAILKLAKEYNYVPNRIANALDYCQYVRPSNYDILSRWMALYKEGRGQNMTPAEAGKYANEKANELDGIIV